MKTTREKLEDFLKNGLDSERFNKFSDDDIVYHYTAMDSFIKMMKLDTENASCDCRFLEIWPSHIFTMNDPLDGAFFSELFIKRVKRHFEEIGDFESLCFMNDFLGKEEALPRYNEIKFCKGSENEEGNIEDHIKLLGVVVHIDRRKYVIKSSSCGYSPFILSFSMRESDEDHRNGKLPLWIPYANNARGVRVGFSVKELKSVVEKYSTFNDFRSNYNNHSIFYGGRDKNRVLKVEYEKKEKIKEIVDELFEKVLKELKETNVCGTVGKTLGLSNFFSVVSDIVMDYSMVLKPEDYKHESEVRVILYQPDASRIPIRVGERGVIPYIKFRMPHQNIKQILFGPAINSLSENFLKYRLESDSNNIEIKKSGINYRA